MLVKQNININLKKYHDIINNDSSLNEYITCYNNFIYPDPPIIGDSTIEFISARL
jgi:hypothetical protein